MALNPDGILQVYCIPFHLTDRTGYLVASHFGGGNLDLTESDDDASFVSSVHSIDPSWSDCMLSILANTHRSLADKMYPPADADFDDDGSNTSIGSGFFQSPHGAHFRKDEYFHGNNTLSPDTIGQSNHFCDAGNQPCADPPN